MSCSLASNKQRLDPRWTAGRRLVQGRIMAIPDVQLMRSVLLPMGVRVRQWGRAARTSLVA